MSRFAKGASISGLIVFGTTTSLFAKIVYEVQSVGLDGEKKFFHKPWAMTSVMFLGMSLCLPLAYWQEFQKKKKKSAGTDVEEPLLPPGAQPPHKKNELKEVLMLSIPTFFDLTATVLMNVGLLWVTASVYQMMRGAEMLFAAAFSVVFLKRKLNHWHLKGLLCCVAGITLVGSSSLLSGEGSATQAISQEQMLLGMGLIIISQAVQAAQLTFEDFFMADMDVAPMKIVGYEGVFGAIGTLLIMAPIALRLPGIEGEGIHENIIDTVEMVRNSTVLQTILAVDMIALLLYNVSGMMVTGQLGAVFRTVLETMRTLFVWLVDLGLFYGGMGLGESWSKYSWLQAAGFVVLVSGTLVYRRGDEEGYRQEMAEALALEAAQEPSETVTTAPALPSAPMAARPIASLIMPTAPMHVGSHGLSSSFRATQTIVTGSYSRSIGRTQGFHHHGAQHTLGGATVSHGYGDE